MKRAVASIALFAAATGADTQPSVKTTKLEGGTELVEVARGLVPIVHFRIAVRLGSAFDPPGKSGLARVATIAIEAGLHASTSDDPRSLERLGVELAAETGVTSAVFFGSVSGENADRAITRIVEGIVHPPATEAAAKNAISRALEERQRALNHDRSLAEGEMKRLLFGSHAYRRLPRGDVREIASIAADDIQALLKRQIRSESILIGVALGSFAAKDDLAERAKKWTESVPKGRAADLDLGPAPEHLRGRKVVLVDKPERRTADVVAGMLIPGALDPRRPALLAAVASIGGSFSSRLMRELATKQRLVTLPIATLEEERSASALEIAFSAEPTKLHHAIRALLDELAAIEKKGLAADEIAFGRTYATARAELDLRDPIRALRSAVAARVLGADASVPWGLPAAIEVVSDEEVRAGTRLADPADDVAIAVVASITPRLQADIGALPGVKSVEIVSWEDR
jgi:zinc protease